MIDRRGVVVFSDSLAHMECVVEERAGGLPTGAAVLGALSEGTEPLRRRTFRLTEEPPRVNLRYGGPYGSRCPSTATAGGVLTISDSGGEGDHEPCRKRSACTRREAVRGERSMVAPTGGRTLDDPTGQSQDNHVHTDTRPVLPRRADMHAR